MSVFGTISKLGLAVALGILIAIGATSYAGMIGDNHGGKNLVGKFASKATEIAKLNGDERRRENEVAVEHENEEDNDQEPSYKGSIIVNNAKGDEFPDLAKVSSQDAVKAALAKVPGKVLKVELENENGYLVYGIEVAKPDSSITDVKIDAGTGTILSLEKEEIRKMMKSDED